MSLARSIGRNTLIQVVGKGIATIFGFITIGLLQRSLGPESYGAYTTVMAYTGFFSVIADLGLYLIVLREIAKPGVDKDKIIGNALSVRVCAAVIILTFGILVSLFFPYGQDVKMGIIIISVSFFFIAIQQVLVSLFQHALKMTSVVVGEIAGRVVLLGLVVYFVYTGATLGRMLFAVVAGSVVNASIVFFQARGLARLRFRVDVVYWKYLFKETWPIAISIVLNLLYFRLDTIFLSVFRSLEEVGLYGAAYKILEILITFPNMFIGLIMPVLSAVAFVERERFAQIFRRAFDVLLICAVPLLVGGMILAEPLIVLVGGTEYASAAPFFRILLIAVTFLFFGALSGHTVTAIHEQRKMVWAYVSVAVVGVLLYLILIPRFGAYGAAIGTVLTEGAIMLAGYWMIAHRTQVRPSFSLVYKILFSAFVMGVVIYFAQSLHVLIVAGIGGAVYVGMIFLTKTVQPSLIREIFSPRQ